MTWLDDALCPKSALDFTPTRPLNAAAAAALARVCNQCPVAADCLTDALEDPNCAGYRAGTWPNDRARLRRHHGTSPAQHGQHRAHH